MRTITRKGTAAFAAVLVLAAGGAACARFAAQTSSVVVTPAWKAPAPSGSTLFTATRCVRALLVQNGAIWAATEGGVLRWESISQPPQIWTTENGLPSNDVRAFRTGESKAEVRAVFGHGEAVITETSAVVPGQTAPSAQISPAAFIKAGANAPLVIVRARAGSDELTATPSALLWKRGAQTQIIALPTGSRASHVSALSPAKSPSVFWAGLWGDGVYRLTLPQNAQKMPRWEKVLLPSIVPCAEITALAASPDENLLIGTRRGGVFTCDPKTLAAVALPLPHSLPSGDIYGLAAYRDRLMVSTFDQGIIEISDATLTGKAEAQTHAALKEGRTLVPFGDRLYALCADHSVGVFDGAVWQAAWPKNTLKRAEVFSLASDESRHRLLVGGWGGWAEWDGETWQQHWDNPLLKNLSVTAVCADKTGAVWLGTQHGLTKVSPDGKSTAFAEASGLADDWITCLAVSAQNRLLVGTYTGGLFEQGDTGRFVTRFHTDTWAIRTISFDGEAALAATPVGVFREDRTGDWQKLNPRDTGGSEAQVLLPVPSGLWVGTRSGLAFLPR